MACCNTLTPQPSPFPLIQCAITTAPLRFSYQGQEGSPHLLLMAQNWRWKGVMAAKAAGGMSRVVGSYPGRPGARPCASRLRGTCKNGQLGQSDNENLLCNWLQRRPRTRDACGLGGGPARPGHCLAKAAHASMAVITAHLQELLLLFPSFSLAGGLTFLPAKATCHSPAGPPRCCPPRRPHRLLQASEVAAGLWCCWGSQAWPSCAAVLAAVVVGRPVHAALRLPMPWHL